MFESKFSATPPVEKLGHWKKNTVNCNLWWKREDRCHTFWKKTHLTKISCICSKMFVAKKNYIDIPTSNFKLYVVPLDRKPEAYPVCQKYGFLSKYLQKCSDSEEARGLKKCVFFQLFIFWKVSFIPTTTWRISCKKPPPNVLSRMASDNDISCHTKTPTKWSCWWLKSCTSWWVASPNIYKVYTSQVVQDFFHQQYHSSVRLGTRFIHAM